MPATEGTQGLIREETGTGSSPKTKAVIEELLKTKVADTSRGLDGPSLGHNQNKVIGQETKEAMGTSQKGKEKEATEDVEAGTTGVADELNDLDRGGGSVANAVVPDVLSSQIK